MLPYAPYVERTVLHNVGQCLSSSPSTSFATTCGVGGIRCGGRCYIISGFVADPGTTAPTLPSGSGGGILMHQTGSADLGTG
jgi:hypothetical protein